MINLKPTQSESTILHVVLSTAVASIIGAATAATQFYFSHGQNLWLALVFFGGSLPTTFGILRYAVWHAIQTNPALAQAEKDAIAQMAAEGKSLGQQALDHIENMWPVLHNLTTQQAAQKAAQSVVEPFSVPQLPFQVTSASVPTAPPAIGMNTNAMNSGTSTPMLNTFPIMPAVSVPTK